MTSYFELTELHIQPRAQGHGLGEALEIAAKIPKKCDGGQGSVEVRPVRPLPTTVDEALSADVSRA